MGSSNVKNRLFITLTDVKGSRQFDVTRQTLIRWLSVVLVLVIALVVYPLIVSAQNKHLKLSNETLLNDKQQGEQKTAQLAAQLEQMFVQLSARAEALALKGQQLDSLEKQINYQPLVDLDSHEQYAALTTEITFRQMVLQLIPNGKPSGYQRVTSSFGNRRHPFLKTTFKHKGIDLNSEIGTPVIATADGVVTSLQNTAQGFGKLIKIRHAMGFTTYYGHLKTIGVDANTFVNKGDIIGYSGNSGRSTGPHLHYEVRFGQTAVDPALFILWTLNNFDQQIEKIQEIPWGSLMAGMQSLMAIQRPQLLPKIVQSPVKSKLTEVCTSTAGCREIFSARAQSPLVNQVALMVK
jgi:murein DD-endopeptidase MepM/ murein hydrolase activator NlpD